MSFYTRKKIWKFLLLIGAFAIGTFTLLYTQRLSSELKKEEQKRAELWAEATRQLTDQVDGDTSIKLIFEVIRNNTTIPVILVDDNDVILHHRNIKIPEQGVEAMLKAELARMREKSEPFVVDLGKGGKQFLYYEDSLLIKKLAWFPVIQLLIVAFFISIAYLAFSGARKAEQDQVWVGMSKETAHQLGTPTSSILGWIDVLKMKGSDLEIAQELEKDVERLQVITDRFSKIGSKPELKLQAVDPIILDILSYLDRRTSADITFKTSIQDEKPTRASVNKVLFQWVIENLCKNAVDAIKEKGEVNISLACEGPKVIIDVMDTGKGISRNNFKTVFQPGYTTKRRGWGLGLSLVKRIVEGYHGGKIFVKESEPGKGTTFRIILPGIQR
ncbi:MAG: HAMP domain-containing histidine kinase [Marinilabiliaceae bacterium]|nr:HAMP domain-containing histidine kinase [Marinilabiliaceae bacterium]